MKGTLVVNGGSFTIESIELRRGRVELVAIRYNIADTFTVAPGDSYEIFGFDGTLIGRGALRMPDGPVTSIGVEDNPAYMQLKLPIGFIGKDLG